MSKLCPMCNVPMKFRDRFKCVACTDPFVKWLTQATLNPKNTRQMDNVLVGGSWASACTLALACSDKQSVLR